MKKKKNIIKQINFKNKIVFFYKKSLKHIINRYYLKNRFFFRRTFILNKTYHLKKLYKYTKNNINYIYNNFIINKLNFFNYFTNNLDLKYANNHLNILGVNFIKDFKKKNHILLNYTDIELIKYQKFIHMLDNNYIYTTINNISNYDIFKTNINLINIYENNNQTTSILLLIIKYF